MKDKLVTTVKSFYPKEVYLFMYSVIFVENNNDRISTFLEFCSKRKQDDSVESKTIISYFMRYKTSIYLKFKKQICDLSGVLSSITKDNIDGFLEYEEASSFLKGNLD